MNANRIAQARNIRRAQLDYLGSQIGMCLLVLLTCIAVYLITTI
jgi:hypothetical protein